MGKAPTALCAGFALLLTASAALADDFGRREAAMAAFDGAFSGLGPDGGCGTPALHGAHAAWDVLTAEERHRVALLSSPLYGEGLEAGAPSWLDGPAFGNTGRDVCFGPTEVDGFSSYELVDESEHFAVFRVSGSAPMVAVIDDVLSLLEETLASFVARQWLAPGGIDDFQMLVFVDARPATLGGYTWVNPCPEVPGGTMDWLVLNEQWARDSELAGPLIAHEIFHTVQRRYAFDEVVTGWEDSANRWFVEASAVYEESLVFPARTELSSARSAWWSERPWVGLETFDGQREYQSFVLPLAVEGALGGPEWHVALWESVAGTTGWSVPQQLDESAVDAGGWEGLFREYVAQASEMELPRVDYLYGPRDLQAFTGIEGGLAGRYAATELPVDGAMEAGSPEAPQSLGANYVWFGTTAAEPSRALRLDVQLDPETPAGEPVVWAVEVVAARAGGVQRRLSVTPDPADPRARVLVHGVAGSIDGVWLIAAPLSSFAGSPPGWTWSARLVAGEDALRIEETEPGCGCSAAGRGDGSALWSLPLLGWIARRRRRPAKRPMGGACAPC